MEHRGLVILRAIAEESGDHLDDVIAGLEGESPSGRYEILSDMYQRDDEAIKDVEDYLAQRKAL